MPSRRSVAGTCRSRSSPAGPATCSPRRSGSEASGRRWTRSGMDGNGRSTSARRAGACEPRPGDPGSRGVVPRRVRDGPGRADHGGRAARVETPHAVRRVRRGRARRADPPPDRRVPDHRRRSRIRDPRVPGPRRECRRHHPGAHRSAAAARSVRRSPRADRPRGGPPGRRPARGDDPPAEPGRARRPGHPPVRHARSASRRSQPSPSRSTATTNHRAGSRPGSCPARSRS